MTTFIAAPCILPPNPATVRIYTYVSSANVLVYATLFATKEGEAQQLYKRMLVENDSDNIVSAVFLNPMSMLFDG